LSVAPVWSSRWIEIKKGRLGRRSNPHMGRRAPLSKGGPVDQQHLDSRETPRRPEGPTLPVTHLQAENHVMANSKQARLPPGLAATRLRRWTCSEARASQ